MINQDLYDRQIRLWGLDVQEKIQSISLLVGNISPLTLELCKNLSLSGVKSTFYIENNKIKHFTIKRFFLEEDDCEEIIDHPEEFTFAVDCDTSFKARHYFKTAYFTDKIIITDLPLEETKQILTQNRVQLKDKPEDKLTISQKMTYGSAFSSKLLLSIAKKQIFNVLYMTPQRILML